MNSKEIIMSSKAPKAIGPYAHANRAGNMVFISGQIPVTAEGEVVEGIEAQAKQCLENVKSIIEEAGGSLDNIVKTTIFLTDLGNFAQVNEVYASYFTEKYPARTTVEISKLPLGVGIEIEAIAVL